MVDLSAWPWPPSGTCAPDGRTQAELAPTTTGSDSEAPIPTPPPDTYAARIVETIQQPLLVLDDHLRVVQANPSFHRTFETSPEATEGRRLQELADGHWDTPGLRHRLDRVLEDGEAFRNFELETSFPKVGRRVL